MRGISILFLLSVCAISGNLGYFTKETDYFITFVFTILFFVAQYPFSFRIKGVKTFILCSVYFIFSLLALYFLSIPLGIKLVMLGLIFLFLFQKVIQSNRFQKMYPVFLLTCFFYLIFLLLYYYVPFFWKEVQLYSNYLSYISASLIQQKALFGSSTMNIQTIILFAIFITILHQFSAKKSYKYLIFLYLFLFLIQIFAVILQLLVTDYLQKYFPMTQLNPMDFIVIPVILCFILLYSTFNRLDIRQGLEKSEKSHQKYFVYGLILLFIGIILVISPNPFTQKKSNRSILLYSRGVLNWNKPVFGSYGLRSSGMFGMLPDYLKAFGLNVKTDSTITRSLLEKTGTLVIFNPDEKFSPQQLNSIRQFVRQGGSLFVLGDHTGLGGIRKPLNHLLEFTGIEFNFDCAHYLKKDWRDSFEFFPHPITKKLNNNRDIGISVGASLTLKSWQAYPLITAKFGFSDKGNALNEHNAFMGNRRYDPGERIGDIILVAASKYGKGKILVFGDTSSLQNGVLCENSDFIVQIFNWLNQQDKLSFIGAKTLVGFLSIILALFCILLAHRIFYNKIGYPVIVLVVSFLFAGMLNHKDASVYFPKGNTACIDMAHLEQVEKYGEMGYWPLTYNLMRNNFLPFIYRSYNKEAMDKSKIFIVISPARKFSQNEIESMHTLIVNGGTVLWSVGYEEKQNSMNVLQKYGFDIDNIPLGPAPKEKTDKSVNFTEAWPIISKNKENTEILCRAWDYPVIMANKIGKGHFILIADSYFLLSRNLETENRVYENNIFFLKSLFEKL